MVAALSLDGYEAVGVVSGPVDGGGFLDFIVNNLVHCMFYLFGLLLNHLPAVKDKSLPIGQEYFDSGQLRDSQDPCPSRNS
jgi:hypothetical protein